MSRLDELIASLKSGDEDPELLAEGLEMLQDADPDFGKAWGSPEKTWGNGDGHAAAGLSGKKAKKKKGVSPGEDELGEEDEGPFDMKKPVGNNGRAGVTAPINKGGMPVNPGEDPDSEQGEPGDDEEERDDEEEARKGRKRRRPTRQEEEEEAEEEAEEEEEEARGQQRCSGCGAAMRGAGKCPNCGMMRKSLARRPPTPEDDLLVPDALRKSLAETPEMEEAYDALEPLQRMNGLLNRYQQAIGSFAKSFDRFSGTLASLDERLGRLEALVMDEIAAEDETDAEETPVAKSAAPAAGVDAETEETLEETGDPKRAAIQKAILTALEKMQSRQDELEEKVSRRPSSPHPITKSAASLVGGPPRLGVNKSLACQIIRKALETKEISEDEFSQAGRMIDYAERMGTTMEDVVRKTCPTTAEKYITAATG